MKSLLKKIIVCILTWEARLLLARTKPDIIAVTGNVGKTSVKDAIFTVLKDRVHARKSEKSYNSELGVPLSILGLENAWSSPLGWLKNLLDGALMVVHPGNYPRLLILEMGVDRPGDMERLTQFVKPRIVVLTRLPDVPVHVEYFGTPEAVTAEKKHLVDALLPDGVLVYNHDDERVRQIAETTRQHSIGYSRYSRSPFMAAAERIAYEEGRPAGCEFTLTHDGGVVVVRVSGSLGLQHAYNAAAAAAVGSLFGVSLSEVAESLSRHEPPAGRMRLLRGLKDTIIIDDTYNASPAAVERALETLSTLKGVKRRIAILGDMLELGRYSVSEHERIGGLVAKSADLLMTVGVRARGIAKGALDAGMNEKKILQHEEATRAGLELEQLIKPGDIILVKGSQSMRMEKIVEEIMAEPERAEELLVRQSTEWKNL
jgi:UDP-N-acetylmuramoyl-tripeptide--D-alanyl-D-alanine ligase